MTFLEYIQHLHRNKTFYGSANRTIADLKEMYNNLIKKS